MATVIVNIPKPCKENWDEMTESGCGKHCKVCDKVVIDFTSMTTDDIQDYFLSHSNQKICGHFKTKQIRNQFTPLQQSLVNIYNHIEARSKRNFINISFLFMVGCALTLTGCNDYTMGAIATPRETLLGDTTYSVQNIDTTANGVDPIKANAINNSSKKKSISNK